MNRLAFFTHGGVGPPGSHESIAALADLIGGLSEWFDITVYTVGKDRDGEGFRCRNARVKGVGALHTDHPLKLLLAFRKSFLRDHRVRPYHLVHGIWTYPAGLAATLLSKRLGIPAVVTVFGGEAASVPAIGYGHMQSLPLRTLTLWTCRSATALIVLTEFQKRLLASHGLTRNDIDIIPTGPIERFVGMYRAGAPRTPVRFLHVANLTEVKDQQGLLQVFARICRRLDARLRIVGPDYLDGKIQEGARALGIDHLIEFTGFVLPEEIPAHYGWADVMLHTSLYEGQGLVVSEAAASGVLVCGTRVGLIADLDGIGTVAVEPGDYDGLAQRVLGVLNNPPQFTRLQENAHRWARDHDLTWTVGRYREVYRRLLPIPMS